MNRPLQSHEARLLHGQIKGNRIFRLSPGEGSSLAGLSGGFLEQFSRYQEAGRHLPHYQNLGRTYFVTFVTRGRWVLPEKARDIVLQHIITEHDWRMFLHVAVVMPDHVHFIGTPFPDVLLNKITKGIKGTSARKINQLLGRDGAVAAPGWGAAATVSAVPGLL